MLGWAYVGWVLLWGWQKQHHPAFYWHLSEFQAEAEDEPARYGAHFVEIEEGSQKYTLTCAVKLAEGEDFPPEPRATKGKAVALG